MILQFSYTFTLIDIVIIICLLIVVAVLEISGILFLRKAKDKPDRIKKYLQGIGLFFILYGISRFIFFIHELIFDPFMWSISIDKYNQLMLASTFKFTRYDIIWRIATGISVGGLLIFLIMFESQILEGKTKFILSIIQGVVLVTSLILGAAGDQLTIGRMILYIGVLPAVAVPFLYFYIGGKASGKTRTKAITAGLGFFLFYLGMSINSSIGKILFSYMWGLAGLQFSYIFYCLMACTGLLIFFKSIEY